jgi:DNA-binding winged helix-turn-helix (wHTH) protein
MPTRTMREVIPVTNTLLRRQMCINAARKMMAAQSDTTPSELIQKLAKRGYTLSDLVHARTAAFRAPDIRQ